MSPTTASIEGVGQPSVGYIEVTNAQHFDAFNAVQRLRQPLRAAARVLHPRDGRDAARTCATAPRCRPARSCAPRRAAATPGAAPAITAANVPAISRVAGGGRPHRLRRHLARGAELTADTPSPVARCIDARRVRSTSPARAARSTSPSGAPATTQTVDRLARAGAHRPRHGRHRGAAGAALARDLPRHLGPRAQPVEPGARAPNTAWRSTSARRSRWSTSWASGGCTGWARRWAARSGCERRRVAARAHPAAAAQRHRTRGRRRRGRSASAVLRRQPAGVRDDGRTRGLFPHRLPALRLAGRQRSGGT